MLTEAFSLMLQLPPLAFSPAAPSPWNPPYELVCEVRELGRPPALRPVRVPNLPRFSTPRAERRYLVGPRIDTAIWVAGLLLSGATGGSVDTRPPEVKRLDPR